LEKFSHPGIEYISNIETNFGSTYSKDLTLEYSNVQIQSDTGYIFNVEDQLEYYTLKLKQEGFHMTPPLPGEHLVTVYFIMNHGKEITLRKYLKLPRLLAEAGGLAKAITFLCLFVMLPYQYFTFNLSIINRIFDFGDDDDRNKEFKSDNIKTMGQWKQTVSKQRGSIFSQIKEESFKQEQGDKVENVKKSGFANEDEDNNGFDEIEDNSKRVSIVNSNDGSRKMIKVQDNGDSPSKMIQKRQSKQVEVNVGQMQQFETEKDNQAYANMSKEEKKKLEDEEKEAAARRKFRLKCRDVISYPFWCCRTEKGHLFGRGVQ